MSEKYKVIESETATFITLTVVGWVDLFIRKVYTDILDESFEYCQKHKGLKIHGYVYMTSHIHLIVSSDENKLQDVVRDFKKYTNKRLIESIISYNESRREWLLNKFSYEAKKTGRASKYKLWQDGFHPIILDSGKKLMQRLNYIHENPLETGLITEEKDWKHSSYNVYFNEERELPNLKIDKLF